MAKKIPLLTPAAGQVIGLKKVDDQVFSSGMMGQGFGLEPSSGQVVAPVDGEVAMVAEAKNLGIKEEHLQELIKRGYQDDGQ